MANGYFERGEIYKVRMDAGVGCEEGAFRPGVILSVNSYNVKSPVVVVAYCTRTAKEQMPNRVEIYATGIRCFVLCDQLAGVDKRRLGTYMGCLSGEELRRVEDGLEYMLDFGYVDDEALKAKEREISDRDAVIAEKDAEIVKLREMVAAAEKKAEEAELSYKVENAMWQRLYDKALTQVVDMKYTSDLFLRDHLGRQEQTERVVPVITRKEPEPPVEEQTEPEDTRLDINHCTITALKKLGFSLSLARQIAERRPYSKVEDLKGIPGMKATQYRIMEPKLCCTPVRKSALVEPDTGCEEPEVVEVPAEPVAVAKVNVNTATKEELIRFTGLGVATVQNIVAYRNKHGRFESLEDLTKVSRFGKTCLKKYGPMLEV